MPDSFLLRSAIAGCEAFSPSPLPRGSYGDPSGSGSVQKRLSLRSARPRDGICPASLVSVGRGPPFEAPTAHGPHGGLGDGYPVSPITMAPLCVLRSSGNRGAQKPRDRLVPEIRPPSQRGRRCHNGPLLSCCGWGSLALGGDRGCTRGSPMPSSRVGFSDSPPLGFSVSGIGPWYDGTFA
jgi:hypothetical protein